MGQSDQVSTDRHDIKDYQKQKEIEVWHLLIVWVLAHDRSPRI